MEDVSVEVAVTGMDAEILDSLWAAVGMTRKTACTLTSLRDNSIGSLLGEELELNVSEGGVEGRRVAHSGGPGRLERDTFVKALTC